MSIFVDENTKVIVQGSDRRPGPVPRPAQPGLRHQGRGRHEPEAGRRGRRGHPGLRHRGRGRRGDRGHRVVHLRAAAAAPPPPSWRPPRPASPSSCASPRASRPRTRPLVYNRLRRGVPRHPAARPELPGHHLPGQVQHRHHLRRHRPARRPGRHRQPLGHARPTRRCTSCPSRASARRPASASAATRCRAPTSSTAWRRSRPTPRPRP